MKEKFCIAEEGLSARINLLLQRPVTLCKTLPIDNAATQEHTRPNLGQEVVCFFFLTCLS
jgi:hypothetical protein